MRSQPARFQLATLANPPRRGTNRVFPLLSVIWVWSDLVVTPSPRAFASCLCCRQSRQVRVWGVELFALWPKRRDVVKKMDIPYESPSESDEVAGLPGYLAEIHEHVRDENV